MKKHVQAAVIGGGVVGCSVLYHLTKLGWKDVCLIERSELTSGSTWHAAGGFHTINGDPNVAKLQDYIIRLYKEIEEISGQSIGLHMTGGVMLAGTPERVDLQHRPDGTWDVVTEHGTIHADHVVNAGGLWARECGRMVGLELPILAMEHQYILTEDIPEVAAINARTGKEVIHAIDFEGEIYMCQERGGMLMGTYERAGQPWSEKETPWDFPQELLQPVLDRIAPSLEVGFSHYPAFENAGIK